MKKSFLLAVLAMGLLSACSNNEKLPTSTSQNMETTSPSAQDNTSKESMGYGWGDNEGGRRTYSIEEINSGELGDLITLNSIKDDDSSLSEEEKRNGVTTPLSDERSFMGIRDEAAKNKENVWNIGESYIEEGKTYIVRMYIHNNNPKGEEAVAKDVTAQVLMENSESDKVKISGVISSSNAQPSRIWHSILLKDKDNRAFHMEYVKDSAILENNIYKEGIQISDELINGGIKLGYDEFDGNLPGCYEYACYISFKVKPVFD